MLSPSWQALITELVPRNEVAAATRLDMVSVNVARAAGPALAGFVIARWGVPPVFVLTAVCASFLAIVLLAWRRPRTRHGEREPFMPALVAGGRYVRHEPVVRLILLRLAAFIVPACAVWALLPLIASRQLGLDAAATGCSSPRWDSVPWPARSDSDGSSSTCRPTQCWGWRRSRSLSPSVRSCSCPDPWSALPLLVVCGFGWTATVATIISELQLFLPGWVRARAIAIYLMVFLGSQAVAAPIWGLVTQHLGLRVAVLAAAVLVAISALRRTGAEGAGEPAPGPRADGLLGSGAGGARAGSGRRADHGVNRV